MLFYFRANCTYRSIEEIMKITGEVLLGALGIKCDKGFYPAFNTVKTWAEKCGLSKAGASGGETLEDWCCIIDESISANAEKLFLVLGAPAGCKGEPLSVSDTRVLGISVAKSHKASDVSELIRQAQESVGTAPEYALGDGGRNLVKGAEDAGLVYHQDCGHAIANVLKSVYGKDEAFQELSASVGRTRRYALSEYAYLMPPAMRSIARYMNLTKWIYWAHHMNENAFPKMRKDERRMYEFLQEHASLVDELYHVMEEINTVLKTIKCEGLSRGTLMKCRAIIYGHMNYSGLNARKVSEGILKYLESESSKMRDKGVPCNISSDIIESYFGYDKSRMSKNKRTGFTSRVLTLALRPYASDASTLDMKDIKGMLDHTTINDVKNWCRKNLGPNQTTKRREKLVA